MVYQKKYYGFLSKKGNYNAVKQVTLASLKYILY